MSSNAADISAIAALVVAVVAMFIALAQALQQYIGSGALMRLGDKSVFGTMPGGAYRKWSWTQFRFRVLYHIPEVKLPRLYYDWQHTLRANDGDDDDENLGTLPPLWASKIGQRELGMQLVSMDSPQFATIVDDAVDEVQNHPFRTIKHRPEHLHLAMIIFLRRVWRRFKRLLKGIPRLTIYQDTHAATRNKQIREKHVSKVVEADAQAEVDDEEEDDDDTRIRKKIISMWTVVCGPSEACWVSFWRMAQYHCTVETTLAIVDGDADRCPADLQVLPMRLSLQDLVTVGFLMGLEIVFQDSTRRLIHMEGPAGILISSLHPLLGTIFRFFPGKYGSRAYDAHRKTIALLVARIWGRASVAGIPISDQEAFELADSNFRTEVQDRDTYALTFYHREAHRSGHANQDGIRIRPSAPDGVQPGHGPHRNSEVQLSAGEQVASKTTAGMRVQTSGPRDRLFVGQRRPILEASQQPTVEDGMPRAQDAGLRSKPSDVEGAQDNGGKQPGLDGSQKQPEKIPFKSAEQHEKFVQKPPRAPSVKWQEPTATMDRAAPRRGMPSEDIPGLGLGSPRRSQTLPTAHGNMGSYARTQEIAKPRTDERALESGRPKLPRAHTGLSSAASSIFTLQNRGRERWQIISRKLRFPGNRSQQASDSLKQSESQGDTGEASSDGQDQARFDPPSRKSTWDEDMRARNREAQMTFMIGHADRRTLWTQHIYHPVVLPKSERDEKIDKPVHRPAATLRDQVGGLELQHRKHERNITGKPPHQLRQRNTSGISPLPFSSNRVPDSNKNQTTAPQPETTSSRGGSNATGMDFGDRENTLASLPDPSTPKARAPKASHQSKDIEASFASGVNTVSMPRAGEMTESRDGSTQSLPVGEHQEVLGASASSAPRPRNEASPESKGRSRESQDSGSRSASRERNGDLSLPPTSDPVVRRSNRRSSHPKKPLPADKELKGHDSTARDGDRREVPYRKITSSSRRNSPVRTERLHTRVSSEGEPDNEVLLGKSASDEDVRNAAAAESDAAHRSERDRAHTQERPRLRQSSRERVRPTRRQQSRSPSSTIVVPLPRTRRVDSVSSASSSIPLFRNLPSPDTSSVPLQRQGVDLDDTFPADDTVTGSERPSTTRDPKSRPSSSRQRESPSPGWVEEAPILTPPLAPSPPHQSILAQQGQSPIGPKCLGSLYWLCQMDIMPGYWITSFSTCINYSLCQAGAGLILETLKLRLNNDTLRWLPPDRGFFQDLKNRLAQGRTTWPRYAHSKQRRGSGRPQNPVTANWSCFAERLMPIILPDYNEKVLRDPGGLNKTATDQDLCELMAIDYWLNEAGHRQEIENGSNDVLRRAPLFVDRLGQKHWAMIWSLAARKGDWKHEEVMSAATYLNQDLSGKLESAEATFMLLAMYRAMRVGQCVWFGVRTESVQWVQSAGGSIYMA